MRILAILNNVPKTILGVLYCIAIFKYTNPVIWATILIGIAITDILDGRIGKKLKKDPLRRQLDNIIDKIIVVAIFLTTTMKTHYSWTPFVFVANIQLLMIFFVWFLSMRGITLFPSNFNRIAVLGLVGGGLAWIFGFHDKILVPLSLFVYFMSFSDLCWAGVLIVHKKDKGSYHLRAFEGLKFGLISFKEAVVIVMRDSELVGFYAGSNRDRRVS